jgi:hypothetical protein
MTLGRQDKEFLDLYTLYSENATLKNEQIFIYNTLLQSIRTFMEGETECSGLVRSL